MYLNCTTEKTVNQQKRFEDALLEIMKTKEIDKTSVVEICEKAGITRRIFYRLFETKYDCLVAAIDHKIMALESFVSKGGAIDFKRLLEHIKEKDSIFNVVEKSRQAGLFMERIFVYSLRENEETKRFIRLFGDAGRDVIFYNISGFVGLLFYWSSTGYSRSVDEMATLLKALIDRPINMPINQMFN